MKCSKILLFLIFIMIISTTTFALDLDVKSKLDGFVQKNLLEEKEKQNLKNPFLIENEAVENFSEKPLDVALEIPSKEANNIIEDNREQQIDKVNNDYRPEIKINGVIRASNSKLALLISYQQQNKVIKIGDKLDNYKLISYKNGEAIFSNKGKELKVLY